MGPSPALGRERRGQGLADLGWAARGAPTAAATAAAPTRSWYPFGCAGCGVGVPQGRRGLN